MPFQKLVDFACAPCVRDVALDETHTFRKAGVFLCWIVQDTYSVCIYFPIYISFGLAEKIVFVRRNSGIPCVRPSNKRS